MKIIFDFIDSTSYNLLDKHSEQMPMRLVKLIAYHYTDARVRKKYWKRLGVAMGEGTFANIGMIAANDGEPTVFIGNNVSIAPYVTFVSVAEANNGKEINTLPYVKEHLTRSQPIHVDDEAWIGANVTILPGVHIGRCSVIGAGSVVTKDVEPYSVYAGVPAKKIRDLKTGERI